MISDLRGKFIQDSKEIWSAELSPGVPWPTLAWTVPQYAIGSLVVFWVIRRNAAF